VSRRLHFRPPDGYVGDIHPFFHDGVYYLFYLKPPLEPERSGIKGMVSALVTSRNLIDWEEVPIKHLPSSGAGAAVSAEALSEPWWAISIIQHRQSQRFFAFYPRGSGIFASTSDNLLTWHPFPVNPVLPPKLDTYREWRDPFVFWNEEERSYWMLLTTSLQGKPEFEGGAISYACSNDLQYWDFKGTLYHPGNIGSPECPEMFRMDKKWYLIASFLTPKGVGKTSYRVADSLHGRWNTMVPDSLDGIDLCAGNTVYDGKRRLLFGWIPTYGGSEESRGQQWGGDLALPREVYVLPNGSLGTRLPNEIGNLGRSRRPIPPSKWLVKQGTWDRGARTLHNLSAPALLVAPSLMKTAYVEVSLRACDKTAAGGVVLCNSAGESLFGVYIDWQQSQLKIVRTLPSGTVTLNSLVLGTLAASDLALRALVEEDILEVFLGNRYSLATRLTRCVAPFVLGVQVERGSIHFQNCSVCELAKPS